MGKKPKRVEEKIEPEVPDAKTKRNIAKAAVTQTENWTGKLPVALLNEHCQKRKWGRVNYDIRTFFCKADNASRHVCTVTLTWTNPKTQELINIRMVPPTDIIKPAEESVVARNLSATYVLHRIAFDKNLKMILPPSHREIWVQLEEERKKLTKQDPERAKLVYNSDPFSAHLEQRKFEEKRQKEKELQQANKEKIKKPTIAISIQKPKETLSKKVTKTEVEPVHQKNNHTSAIRSTFPRKVWENATTMDLSPESRELIESSIKSHIDWTSHDSKLNDEDKKSFIPVLDKLGFRKVHIEEALNYTNSLTETLEWLIFHIPEDDLPSYFENRDANLSLKVTGELQKEYIMKRLSEGGFNKNEILVALKKFKDNEVLAAEYLTQTLIDDYDESKALAANDSQELWDQETESLEIIYGKDFMKKIDEQTIEIKLNPEHLKPGLLSLKVYKSQKYPNSIPGLYLVVNNSSYKLASYIKISIIQKLLKYIINYELLGDCIIHSCVDWLNENISQIIEDPGPLFDPNLKKIHKFERNQVIPDNTTRKSNKKSNRTFQTIDNTEELKTKYELKLKSSEVLQSLAKRSKLPAWSKKDELIEIINSNKVTLVTGETGSGKSTQIVQFILDYMNSKGDFNHSILCTQPRRISTIGLAERISEERCEKCGEETGYIIRGENKTSNRTRISFVTTGVLLRMIQGLLMNKDASSSKVFDSVGYIFIDEVHERSIDSDFLLIILKKIRSNYPHLKIILMSATINISVFKSFFDDQLSHVHISGRTFPIKDYYLDEILEDIDFTIKSNNAENYMNGEEGELRPKASSKFFATGNINYDLISKLVIKVDKDMANESNFGSILIFLPGIMEINQCIRNIDNSFNNHGRKLFLLPLHSALSSNDQKKVFQIPSSNSVRKVVVSTNVAETSITIPDVVAVIDSGRSKSLFYDAKLNTTKLIENWCSKAEVNQRRGRSGRVRDGNCYRLYTKETESNMLSQPIPEIKRTRLENVYLIVKSMGISDVSSFLKNNIDPPEEESLIKSKQFLEEIGAIVDDNLTNLGSYLSMLPTDLQSGKLLIFGTIFGCLDICLTLASISTNGSTFINNFEKREIVKKVQNSFSNGQGDLMAIVNSYDKYHELIKEKASSSYLKNWLDNNYLSYRKMKDIESTRAQYVSILRELGFIPFKYSSDSTYLNRNRNNSNVIRAIITGSFYPQISRVELPDTKYSSSSSGAIAMDPDAKNIKLWIRNENYTGIPTNSNAHIDRDKEKENKELPATRAFIHPSSVLFSGNGGNIQGDEISVSEDYDFTPSAQRVSKNKDNLLSKSAFIAYQSSQHTTKLYLRDITPTSTLSVLLFGGSITYDLGAINSSSFIVLDNWLPIRTWCKNAVLIKQLRILLDNIIAQKLAVPGNSDNVDFTGNDVLEIVEKVLETTV